MTKEELVSFVLDRIRSLASLANKPGINTKLIVDDTTTEIVEAINKYDTKNN